MRLTAKVIRSAVCLSMTAALTGCGELTSSAPDRRVNAAINASASAAASSFAKVSTARALPPLHLPKTGTLLMIGDAGATGYPEVPHINLSLLTAGLLGWHSTVLYATGFATSDSVIHQLKISGASLTRPDLVIVEEGINDRTASAAEETAGVQAAFNELGRLFPSVPLVIVGPLAPSVGSDTIRLAVNAVIAQEAAVLGIHYVNPLLDAWVNSADASRLLAGPAGHVYFTAAGQHYLAARLVANLYLDATFG